MTEKKFIYHDCTGQGFGYLEIPVGEKCPLCDEMMSNTVLYENFLHLNYRHFKMPIIVVYENPLDFPGKFVARIFDLEDATPYCMVADTLEDIRAGIPQYRFNMLKPSPDDEPHIKETWL